MTRQPIPSPADSQNPAAIKSRFSTSWDSAAQATPWLASHQLMPQHASPARALRGEDSGLTGPRPNVKGSIVSGG
jgi:hypothetical protein